MSAHWPYIVGWQGRVSTESLAVPFCCNQPWGLRSPIPFVCHPHQRLAWRRSNTAPRNSLQGITLPEVWWAKPPLCAQLLQKQGRCLDAHIWSVVRLVLNIPHMYTIVTKQTLCWPLMTSHLAGRDVVGTGERRGIPGLQEWQNEEPGSSYSEWSEDILRLQRLVSPHCTPNCKAPDRINTKLIAH